MARGETECDQPVEVGVRNRDRRELSNGVHPGTSQQDHSTRRSRAE
jgi:hypothetical protein